MITRPDLNDRELIELVQRLWKLSPSDMPPLQFDEDGGEVWLSWINLRLKRTVSFQRQDGMTVLGYVDDTHGDSIFDPSDVQIAHHLLWVLGR